MKRNDLLAISEEDLVIYTNRGTVNRAKKEFNSGKIDVQITENEQGDLILKWSDDVVTTFPVDKTFEESVCSCPAAGICRHIVRSIFFLKAEEQKTSQKEDVAEESELWTPGSFTDEDLLKQFGTRVFKSAKKLYDTGILFELFPGSKPMAYIYNFGVTLRFPVVKDLRYYQSNSKDDMLSQKSVCLAVWAFRQDKTGFISTKTEITEIPKKELKNADQIFQSVLENGLSKVSSHMGDNLKVLENSLRENNWLWPAENIETFYTAFQQYRQIDSLFHPSEIISAIGEFEIRKQAACNYNGKLPVDFILGGAFSYSTPMVKTKLSGLGTRIIKSVDGVILKIYYFDYNANDILTFEKSFPDKLSEKGEKKEQESFSSLGTKSAFRGISFNNAGVSFLLLGSGKRSAGNKIVPGNDLSVLPGKYEWTNLPESIFIENYKDLKPRMESLPPSVLRPRGDLLNFFVLKVDSIKNVVFNSLYQRIEGVFVDKSAAEIIFQFPYTSRGKEGVESFFRILNSKECKIEFVTGTLSFQGIILVFNPVAVVYVIGNHRNIFQPWIDRKVETKGEYDEVISASNNKEQKTALAQWMTDYLFELGEIVLLGLNTIYKTSCNNWKELAQRAQALGMIKIALILEEFSSLLESNFHKTNNDYEKEISLLKYQFEWITLGQEIAGE